MHLHDRHSRANEPLPSIHTWFRHDTNLFPPSPALSLNFRYEGNKSQGTYDVQLHGPTPQTTRQQCTPTSRSPVVRDFDGHPPVFPADLPLRRLSGCHIRERNRSSRQTRGPGATLVINERYDDDGAKDARQIIRDALLNWSGDDLQRVKSQVDPDRMDGDAATTTTKGNSGLKRQAGTKRPAIEDIDKMLDKARDQRPNPEAHQTDRVLKENLMNSANTLRDALALEQKIDEVDRETLILKLTKIVDWSNGSWTVSRAEYNVHRKELDGVENCIRRSYAHTLAERQRRIRHSRIMERMAARCPDVIHALAKQVHRFKPGTKPGKYYDYFANDLLLEFYDLLHEVLAEEKTITKDRALAAEEGKRNAETKTREYHHKVLELRLQNDRLRNLLESRPKFDERETEFQGRDCAEFGSPSKRRRFPSPSSTESWDRVSRSSRSPPPC